MTVIAPAAVVGSRSSWSSRVLGVLLFIAACAGSAFWGFEKGGEFAGVNSNTEEELTQLRATVTELKAELNSAQTIVNTSDSKLTTERAIQSRLQAEVDRLTTENSQLRNDLGFYENLIPSENANKVEIRGLQATASGKKSTTGKPQLQWQVLLMHPQKSAKKTTGTLYLSYTYEHNGQQKTVQAHKMPVDFKQHKRFDGVLELAADHTIIKKFSVALKRGKAVLAEESIPVG